MCLCVIKNHSAHKDLCSKLTHDYLLPPEWRHRGGERGRRQKVQTASPARAPLHPPAQTGLIHCSDPLLHHTLPEPPALPCTAGRQPPHHAPVHTSTDPQPRPRGLGPLLLHFPVFSCSRQPGPAAACYAQVGHTEPVTFQ